MKYGQPNDIVTVEDEPHARPTRYGSMMTSLHGQRNVKFLFYNPNLTPNDFVLLHSTARTERQNPRWEIELYEKAGASDQRHEYPRCHRGDGPILSECPPVFQ